MSCGTKVWSGAPLGTNQRLFFSNVTGTWAFAVQSNSVASNSDFPVAAGWSFICGRFDSGTATLFVNGVPGTGSQSVKAYTSYTLAGNFQIGSVSGLGTSVAPGLTVDDVYIYTSALTNQEILDLYESLNTPAPVATGTYSQVAHQFQRLRVNSSGDAINYYAANAQVQVVTGGAFALITQIDCTTDDCDPLSLRLRYSKNGGAFQEVPDVMGADLIAFYGAVPDQDLVNGTVTCCLSGALTANDGSTQLTAAAVPNVDLAQNASFVRRSVLKLGAATPGDVYCFKEYNQDGNAMDSVTPSAGACVTVIAMQAGGGF